MKYTHEHRIRLKITEGIPLFQRVGTKDTPIKLKIAKKHMEYKE